MINTMDDDEDHGAGGWYGLPAGAQVVQGDGLHPGREAEAGHPRALATQVYLSVVSIEIYRRRIYTEENAKVVAAGPNPGRIYSSPIS